MVLLATSNSFSTYRAARLHDQSGRAVSTNASSEELLYNVGPTQCQEVCVNLQMDAAAPPPHELCCFQTQRSQSEGISPSPNEVYDSHFLVGYARFDSL